jgi:hypothetical protein
MVLVDRVVPLVATFPAPCPEQAGGLGKKNRIYRRRSLLSEQWG